jgi:hypothetical protein
MRGWISFAAAVICFLTPLACRPTVAHGGGDDAVAETRKNFQGVWRFELKPVQAAEREGAVAFPEAWLVEGDRMTPETFAVYGFNPATVTIDGAMPEMFSATMASATKGTLQWSGRIGVGAVQGSVLWTKVDGGKWKYRYVARRTND